MNTVSKDERWLTDVTPINFQAREIVFYEMKITWSYAKSIEQMVKWNNYFVGEETFKIPFWDRKEIFDVAWKWNSFVIEYEDSIERDNDIKLLKQKFELDWKHFTKLLENNRHIPELDWYFEYDWKYYVIVDWLNKLTDEVNESLWIYKWVIVSPNLYYWISEDSENRVKKTVEKVEKIID